MEDKIKNILNPFPNDKFLDSTKLKKFADDNFKLSENGGKFSKRVETLWEKEKLLFTSNFSFSHSVFVRVIKCFHKSVFIRVILKTRKLV